MLPVEVLAASVEESVLQSVNQLALYHHLQIYNELCEANHKDVLPAREHKMHTYSDYSLMFCCGVP